MISDAGDELHSTRVDFKTMSSREVLCTKRQELKSVLSGFGWQEKDQYHTDALEQCTIQWVYRKSIAGYHLVGSEAGNVRIERE